MLLFPNKKLSYNKYSYVNHTSVHHMNMRIRQTARTRSLNLHKILYIYAMILY